ncbi:MAG: hypothetical protein ACSHX5_02210 [Phycisphaerales bacterium]
MFYRERINPLDLISAETHSRLAFEHQIDNPVGRFTRDSRAMTDLDEFPAITRDQSIGTTQSPRLDHERDEMFWVGSIQFCLHL